MTAAPAPQPDEEHYAPAALTWLAEYACLPHLQLLTHEHGSMHTARDAAELGRPLMAVSRGRSPLPSRPVATRSSGTATPSWEPAGLT
jgi:hypothetical protein